MNVLNKVFPCRLSSNGCSGPNIICGGDPGYRFTNILTWKSSKSVVFFPIFYHLNFQGSRKLPPAWEEREEYDSLAPLPVIPR